MAVGLVSFEIDPVAVGVLAAKVDPVVGSRTRTAGSFFFELRVRRQ